jgi:hypothetical protein
MQPSLFVESNQSVDSLEKLGVVLALYFSGGWGHIKESKIQLYLLASPQAQSISSDEAMHYAWAAYPSYNACALSRETPNAPGLSSSAPNCWSCLRRMWFCRLHL